jgi:hypothetical protein
MSVGLGYAYKIVAFRMKLKIITLIVCLFAQLANARPPQVANRYLIDLTPGGFYEPDAEHWPQAFIDFLVSQPPDGDLLFFDEMIAVPYEINGVEYPPGWVSQFGVLIGGTYFFCHIDQTGPVPVTIIRWDFTGSGYYLDTIYIHDNETDFTSLYKIRIGNRGVGRVTIDNFKRIDDIAFYGKIR